MTAGLFARKSLPRSDKEYRLWMCRLPYASCGGSTDPWITDRSPKKWSEGMGGEVRVKKRSPRRDNPPHWGRRIVAPWTGVRNREARDRVSVWGGSAAAVLMRAAVLAAASLAAAASLVVAGLVSGVLAGSGGLFVVRGTRVAFRIPNSNGIRNTKTRNNFRRFYLHRQRSRNIASSIIV